MSTYIVIQTAFIGDVLLTLPICTAIKKLYPESRVILITTPVAASMLMNNVLGIEVTSFDKKQRTKVNIQHESLKLQLKLQDDTIAFVPHKSASSAALVKALKVQKTYTYSDAAAKKYATASIEYPLLKHDADRHFALLELAGITINGTKESFTPLEIIPQAIQQHTISKFALPAEYVVLAPATVWATKQWPIEHWCSLAQRLAVHTNVVIVGDTSVLGMFSNIEGVADLTGKTNLEEVLGVIGGAKAVVANDSAPVHMASLLGVPAVVFFGPTVPEYGFSPFSDNSVIVQNSQLRCRPCTRHGGVSCPLGTHECLQMLKPSDVERQILGILQHEIS